MSPRRRSVQLLSCTDLFVEGRLEFALEDSGVRRARSVQPRPHSALRQSPAFALRFLADRMRRSVEGVLAEQGYSWCEYTALTVVCEVVGLSQTALAERTAFDRTRISEAVARRSCPSTRVSVPGSPRYSRS
jgi:hypothetical protein